jgi:hypothetical protein
VIQTGRVVVVALMAVAAVMVPGPARAQDEAIAAPGLEVATIVLHVTNYAALSSDLLNVVRTRVAMVYEPIGVRIVWVEGAGSVKHREDGRLHLTVLLLSRDMAARKISAENIKDNVLGQAHPSSGRASIFCDRIASMSGALRHFPMLLGDVIAHEVGHLVLGVDSHSRSGIMRAYANVRAFGPQNFEKTQARSIRKTLMELTTDDIRR